VRETIFEYAPESETREYILVQANNDGGAVIRVSSLGGGFASIDLPVDQLAELGRKLLARAAAYEIVDSPSITNLD
jgi:uridine phosphorylase